MKLMDIQTHSDYVELMNATHLKKWQLHRKRVEFGRQPLTLGMFVPINEKGEVLEKPDIKNHFLSKVAFRSSYTRDYKEYSQAKERVLFEGFELEEVTDEGIAIVLYDSHFFGAYDLSKSIFVGRRTNIIEGLIKNDLTLTQTAIKQLGL